MSGARVEELCARLARELTARMTVAGWAILDSAPWGLHDIAAFRRAFDADFSVIAEFPRHATSDDADLVVESPRIGIGYEPLRQLVPLLGSRAQSPHRSWDARRIDEDDVVDDEGDDDEWTREITSLDQCADAADELVRPVLEHAPEIIARYADLDGLVGACRDGEAILLSGVGVLAAAHRFTEAESALVRYPFELSRDEERFVRQLRRWMRSGGDPALIPDPSGPRPQYSPEPASAKEILRQARERRAAVDAVRRAGAGRDRDALRSMLEDELGRRGLTERPLWKERTLDHLFDEPSLRGTLKSLKALGGTWLDVFHALREVPTEAPIPGWLRPPARAWMDIGGQVPRAWTAVVLDAAARDWLDRAHAALPDMGGSVRLEAWVDRDGEQIAVHLGDRRVGHISEQEIAAYVAALEAAAFLDEVPCLNAWLTRRPVPSGYLLEVALPAAR